MLQKTCHLIRQSVLKFLLKRGGNVTRPIIETLTAKKGAQRKSGKEHRERVEWSAEKERNGTQRKSGMERRERLN